MDTIRAPIPDLPLEYPRISMPDERSGRTGAVLGVAFALSLTVAAGMFLLFGVA